MDQAMNLEAIALHLDKGRIAQAARDGTVRSRSELAVGHYVSAWSYATAWDYRERHPDGDELVYVVQGDATMELGDLGAEREVHVRAGEACVVPAGTWHRLSSDDLCTLLFVTPSPARTEHEVCAQRAD